jgi:hypothetical protein
MQKSPFFAVAVTFYCKLFDNACLPPGAVQAILDRVFCPYGHECHVKWSTVGVSVSYFLLQYILIILGRLSHLLFALDV